MAQVVLLGAALALVGCDNSVNFSPTEPRFPGYSGVGERSLEIKGTLQAAGGTCLRATVLFDGQELAGARTTCPDPAGCAELELTAVTPSSSGRHTISFQVLGQSADAVDYLVRGVVVVHREGLSLGGAFLDLGRQSATLRPGESVSFEVFFED